MPLFADYYQPSRRDIRLIFQQRGSLMNAVIWLVDDDTPLRESIAFLLKTLGYEVLDFAELAGFEACTPAPDADPFCGCLLLDVPLADFNGPGWLEDNKQRNPLLPVIIMDDHDIPDAYRRDAFAAFTKPLDIEQLLVSIKQAMEESARRVERWHAG